jgi:apolipoprotein N-acyltransferase
MSPLTFLLFIAWVPWLWIEDHVSNARRLFGLAYVHMVVWNILVTWWVANASLPGALGAFFANSLIMCVPWLLMYFTKRRFGRWIGYGSLIIYWIAFEYIHHIWELSWPWLTLGNAFALRPEWVQWYEYTSNTGGSIWVLLSNIIIYGLFVEYKNYGRTKLYYTGLGGWIILLAVPILISGSILKREKKTVEAGFTSFKDNVVVVQPNIDAYTEKFNIPVGIQLQKLIVLAEQKIDENTSLVVWPETAIPAQVWEDEIKYDADYFSVWSFLKRHPRISLLTGIDSYKNYGPDKKNASNTARFDKEGNYYYDAFNTAVMLQVDSTIYVHDTTYETKLDSSIQIYHKAKLVPGVETLPSFLQWMGSLFEDFGGISGTLGRDNERKVFLTRRYYKAAPVICYESIYSDYITEYIRKGANLLTIITNDGWWGNTAGYRQHMNYARLRAIETRKWVARSANTGISCFIDPLGNVITPLPWDTEGAIKLTVPADNRQTFFVKNGDIISRAMLIVTIGLIVLNIGFWIRIRLLKKVKE